MDLFLNPKKITNALVLIALLLFAAHIVAQVLVLVVGDDRFYGFVPLFHFNEEKNAPTYFSSLMLAFAAALLAVIALSKKGQPYFWHWLGLSAIFLFVSFDELAAVHETFTTPVRNNLGTSGLLYYAWILPYMAAMIVLVLLYARFFFQLPPRTRLLFFIAAGLFLSGAVGAEALGGAVFESEGSGRNLPYVMLMTLEETLEMAGTILFLYALLRYVQLYIPGLSVRVAPPERARALQPVGVKAQAHTAMEQKRAVSKGQG